MNTVFDFDSTAQSQRLVYVRPVEVAELPVEAQAKMKGIDHIYALHSADGERLALVRERSLAFALARQNDFNPVTVH